MDNWNRRWKNRWFRSCNTSYANSNYSGTTTGSPTVTTDGTDTILTL
jgi:hypothetical protein